MGLEVATVLDALRDGTVNAEPILLSFLHRLLPQRHCKATTSVVPGFLLMHVRTEGRLVKVDHRSAVHYPVRHAHGELDALGFKFYRVLPVRIQLSVCWCLLDTVAKVEVPECLHLDINIVELLDLGRSLTESEVHPVGEAGTAQQVLLCFH